MGMDVFGLLPAAESGKYFRASVWSWRPIVCLIREANEKFTLGFDLRHFGTNDGYGLRSQAECDRLASSLQLLLQETDAKEFTLDEEPSGPEGAVLKMLRRMGWTVSDNPHAAKHVACCKPAYCTDREQVEEFITFLKHCGGFEIW